MAFLRRFPTAEKAAWLSPRRLANWLSSVGYTGGIPAAELYRRLERAAPGLAGPEGEARGAITVGLVAMLEAINGEVGHLEGQIAELFAAHPDQHIFSNLPRSGVVRAASLLAEIGDCRERFPTDGALAALAGASPSTTTIRQAGTGRRLSRRAWNLRWRSPA